MFRLKRQLFEKSGFLLLCLISTSLILTSFSLINLYSLWIGGIDALITIKLSFVLLCVFIYSYTVFDFLLSLAHGDKAIGIFSSLLEIVVPSSLITIFSPSLQEFIFGVVLPQNLCALPYDVKVATTFGMIPPLFFIWTLLSVFQRTLRKERPFMSVDFYILLEKLKSLLT